MTRPKDTERVNRVEAFSGRVRACVGVPMTRGEFLEGCRKAYDQANADGLIKHNKRRFTIGLEAGDDCKIKLRDGSIVRGAFVVAHGPKRVTVDSLGTMLRGEWVPES